MIVSRLPHFLTVQFSHLKKIIKILVTFLPCASHSYKKSSSKSLFCYRKQSAFESALGGSWKHLGTWRHRAMDGCDRPVADLLCDGDGGVKTGVICPECLVTPTADSGAGNEGVSSQQMDPPRSAPRDPRFWPLCPSLGSGDTWSRSGSGCASAGASTVEPCSHGGCVPSKATVAQAGMASRLCRRLAVFPFITNKGQFFEAM